MTETSRFGHPISRHGAARRQRGVTLLEVLVGFVIFTTTLVAVLDYVSSQVFHVRRTFTSLEMVQLVYSDIMSPESGREAGALRLQGRSTSYGRLVSLSALEARELRDREMRLNRYRYSIIDRDDSLEWVVLRVDWNELDAK